MYGPACFRVAWSFSSLCGRSGWNRPPKVAVVDPRFLSVIFLLLAGVLPLRELSGNWSAPARRALWAAYGLVAVAAVAALVNGAPRRWEPSPRRPGAEQLACFGRACTPGAARA